MPELLLPRSVVREIAKRKWAEQRAEWRAQLDKMFDWNDPVCVAWSPYLRELCPQLRLGRAKGRAAEPGFTVLPGYYHWVRDNETAPPTVTPITGPEGEWREPDSGVLEDLAMCDLQNPKVFMRLLAQREERERAIEEERAREREERQQEILGRYLAGTRVQVSMNDHSPWTQNARGRRQRR